jgi:hypothetical protein
VADDLVWVLLSAERPRDNQQVYARVRYGLAHKVTFYTQPTPRWEGGSIVYELDYFAEWAAVPAGAARTRRT